MPRVDRSVSILTGMIIAALYVIMLVGFVQESYMRRDAANREDSVGRWPTVGDVSKQVCRAGPSLGAALLPYAVERQSCGISIDTVRRYLGAQ